MISFDAALYNLKALEQAVRDYTKIAKIRIHDRGDKYECEILQTQVEPELLIHEFSNYVLDLSVMMEGKQNHDLR